MFVKDLLHVPSGRLREPPTLRATVGVPFPTAATSVASEASTAIISTLISPICWLNYDRYNGIIDLILPQGFSLDATDSFPIGLPTQSPTAGPGAVDSSVILSTTTPSFLQTQTQPAESHSPSILPTPSTGTSTSASSSYDAPSSSLVSLASPSSSTSSTRPTTAQSPAPDTQSDPSAHSSSRSRMGAIGGGVGGAGAVLCMVLAVIVWRYKRRASRRRLSGVQSDKELACGEADVSPESASAVRESGHILVEDKAEDAAPKGKGNMDDVDKSTDRRPSSDASVMSNRTTLASNSATVGSPHTPSYHTMNIPPPSLPPLPLVPPSQSPPSAFSTRRRQATDAGVRLAGRGVALRRLNSNATSSVDSLSTLSTLPPPYEPHE